MADKKISALTAATTPLGGTEVLPIVQSGATVNVSVDNLTVKNVRSNATTGILQVSGPAASSTRVMSVPDANFTAARIDTAQTFTGDNTFGDTTYTGFVKVVAGKGLAYNANTAVFMTPEDNIQGARIAAGGSFKLLVGGGSEAINVDATSKDVKTTAGNLVIGTADKGIDFSASSHAAGMTSELLNDYEEGTFTPVASQLTTAPTIVYSSRTGKYTKVGRVVTVHIEIIITTSVGGSGTTVITGLPYTPNEGTYGGQGMIGYNDALANTVYGCWVSGTSVVFRSGTRSSANDAGGWSSGGYLGLTLVYQV